jgi:hypothetical protein
VSLFHFSASVKRLSQLFFSAFISKIQGFSFDLVVFSNGRSRSVGDISQRFVDKSTTREKKSEPIFYALNLDLATEKEHGNLKLVKATLAPPPTSELGPHSHQLSNSSTEHAQ